MFNKLKAWRKEWQIARKYFESDNKTRHVYTNNFNKKWGALSKKAAKMVESEDYETHVKGQIMLYNCWEANRKYDVMVGRVIMMEILDDFKEFAKEELKKNT